MSGHLRVDLGPGAQALFTTRHGGASEGPYASLNLGPWTDDDPDAVAENRRRAAELAGGRELAQGHQVHGTAVAVAVPGAPVRDADAQVTTDPALAPTVLTADCLPIAIATGGAVAMVHAGWRGLAGGVVEAAVAALRDQEVPGTFSRGQKVPGTFWSGVGPGAGVCCYEVGDEVAAHFGARHRQGRNLDLKGFAADALRAAGVTHVEDVERCTMCEPETFFSHRRSGGVTGRQAGIAWLS